MRLTGKDELRHDMTEQQLSQYDAVNESAEPADPWRNEVQDRLARYKRRRGRRIEGAFTMRFPFPADDPAVPVEPSPAAVAVATAVADMLEEEVGTASGRAVGARRAGGSRILPSKRLRKSRLRLSEESPAAVDLVLEAPVVPEEAEARTVCRSASPAETKAESHRISPAALGHGGSGIPSR